MKYHNHGEYSGEDSKNQIHQFLSIHGVNNTPAVITLSTARDRSCSSITASRLLKDNLSIHFYECAFTFTSVDDRFIFVCITCTGSGYGSFERVPLSVQNKQNMFRIVGKMYAE